MRRMLFRPWPISNLSSQFWPNLHLVAGIPCVRAASKDSATQGTGPVSKPYPLPKGKERQARDAALPPNRIHPTACARRSARARRWANEFPADRGPGLPSRHDCRHPDGAGKPLAVLSRWRRARPKPYGLDVARPARRMANAARPMAARFLRMGFFEPGPYRNDTHGSE